MCHHNTILMEWHEGQETKLTPELLCRHTEVSHRILSHLSPPSTGAQLRKPFSCFLPTFCMPDSTVCFQFNRGTNTQPVFSGEKTLSFSSVQEQMTLGDLCKASFSSNLSIATGLFPCLVEYHSAGWECFLLIYWCCYLKVHLSATMVNSHLISQTLGISGVFCKRLSKDEVGQKGRGCQALRNSRCDLFNI